MLGETTSLQEESPGGPGGPFSPGGPFTPIPICPFGPGCPGCPGGPWKIYIQKLICSKIYLMYPKILVYGSMLSGQVNKAMEF